MSLGGRMVMAAEAYPMVPVACLPPQHSHQPAVACLTRHPSTHTSWTTTTTTPAYGGFHPPYQGAYSALPALAPPAAVMHKPSNSSPPASKKCPSVPLPQLSRTSFHVGYYVPPSVQPGDLYGGLEEVWNHHFESLFRHLPHMWSFGPAETPPSDCHVFRDMAKVRFSCQRCSHGWTSMYGLVVFYYRWDAATTQGLVRFLLTGQKCNQCDVEDFETPMWYPEEAQKVMTNLYHEVAGRIYMLQTPPLIKDRRHGRPRQQHNALMCEGCRQGLCKTNKTPAAPPTGQHTSAAPPTGPNTPAAPPTGPHTPATPPTGLHTPAAPPTAPPTSPQTPTSPLTGPQSPAAPPTGPPTSPQTPTAPPTDPQTPTAPPPAPQTTAPPPPAPHT